MEFEGKIEFKPVIKPEVGMLVAYRGSYNNDTKLPYIITSNTKDEISLQNDYLEISEIFSIKSGELQEIVCTFDVPTKDINFTKTGIVKTYEVKFLNFKTIEELTYILSNNLDTVKIEYNQGEITLMGKNHIDIASITKKTAVTTTDKFAEIFKLLGIQQEPTSTKNNLKIIAETLKCIGYIPFPISLSTVDIVPYYINKNGNIFLLMGRKPKQEKFQFVGGFRDPAETNEYAASRELNEEASIKLDENRFKFHGTYWIDDRRYKDSVHKITTALFTVEITYDEMILAKGADDMEEVKGFLLSDLIRNQKEDIRDVHHALFDRIVKIFS